jgi:hypothetical protein
MHGIVCRSQRDGNTQHHEQCGRVSTNRWVTGTKID